MIVSNAKKNAMQRKNRPRGPFGRRQRGRIKDQVSKNSDPDPLIQGDVTSSLSRFMMITGPQAGRHTPDQSSEFISDSLILIQGT